MRFPQWTASPDFKPQHPAKTNFAPNRPGKAEIAGNFALGFNCRHFD
jgi:hypothetical protein